MTTTADLGEGIEQVDVAIVGFGPVGRALAILLGKAGHRVAVFERFGESYRMPRAVHLDHEVMRIVQSLDVAGPLIDELLPPRRVPMVWSRRRSAHDAGWSRSDALGLGA